MTSVEGFKEFLHREFPRQASEWIDDEGRRNFLKIMGASLALAGMSACTRQPTEYIMPYVEAPEQLVPGKAAFLRDSVSGERHRESGSGRNARIPAHEGRRQSRTSGQPGLDGRSDAGFHPRLYDPDRLQTVNFIDEVRSYTSFLETFINAFGEAAGEGRRGDSDPDGDRHVADALLRRFRMS